MEHQSGRAPSISSLKMEDENIFGPPALSAYSIAILNSHSSSQGRPSSGPLSQTETTDKMELKNTLKRKFSVQFAETDPSLLPSRASLGVHQAGSYLKSETNATFSANDEKNINISMENHNNDLNEGNTSHAFSPGLTNTSSGSSSFGRAGLSPITHNSFSAYSEGAAGTLTPKPVAKVEYKPTESAQTTNIEGFHSLQMPGSLSNLINLQAPIPHKFTGQSIKKSRLLHNPRSLGPPKRVSKILIAESTSSILKEEILVTEPTTSILKEEAPIVQLPRKDEKLSSNCHVNISQPSHNPFTDNNEVAVLPITSKRSLELEKSDQQHTTISNKSDFFESLRNLKKRSPEGLTPISSLIEVPMKSQHFDHIFVKQKTFDVLSDRKSSEDQPKGWTANTISERRPPLSDISRSTVNIAPKDSFVKPAKPRLYPSGVARDPINKPKAIINDAEPVNHASSKKLLVVNGKLYEKLELLGRGGSSKVYKVRHTGNKKIYAIKKVDYDQFDDSCIQGFKSEIEHLIKLKDHSRVVSLEDHDIQDSSIYLVMECGELDLAHVLQRRTAEEPLLDVNFVRFQAAEMFRCVQAVHQAGIVHSDLKPANFLFVRGLMKIIDFGIANAVPEHTTNIYRESQIGTPNYMAPETLIECGQASCPKSKGSTTTWKVGKPSDVWSCGCILYQMIYGKPPYASFPGATRIKAIMDPDTKILYPEVGLGGGRVPQSAITLMRGCLDRVPNFRWSLEECLSSDFLKPKIVSRAYIRDLIYSAVNYGMERKEEVSRDTYDQLVETVLEHIDNLNFA